MARASSTPANTSRVAAGTLSITGGLQLVFDGALRIEAAGPTPGVDFGVLDVGTLAVLDGTLELEFVDGYIPELGTSFPFLTANSIVGEFETIDAGGFELDLDYGPSGVSATVVAVSAVPEPGFDPGPGSSPLAPERTELLGARPNPFSGAAEIRWSAATAQRTRVSVVDAAGRVVRVLQDGPSGVGIHRVSWDGRSDRGDRVGSGVYFIRMETESGPFSRRVVYLE